jgi:hypothetical protein
MGKRFWAAWFPENRPGARDTPEETLRANYSAEYGWRRL